MTKRQQAKTVKASERALQLLATVHTKHGGAVTPQALCDELDPDWLFEAPTKMPAHTARAARICELAALIDQLEQDELLTYEYAGGTGGLKTYVVTAEGRVALGEP